MAGKIRAEDILAVKERTSIEEVVREHVTLTRRGSALVGLCPFHDEKTGSFNVNPHNGFYHCYGCGAGGDVIKFVTEIEHLTFTEAVERLAAKCGVELRYEDGGGRREEAGGAGRRARLIEAHRVAQEFYAAYLLSAGEARAGRDFMRERGFDGTVAKRFGVGFAPRGGEELVRHLRGKGFSDDELVTGGLAGRGTRGLYDRFRGRLVWPIRDITGDTVGFGARRIFPDDRIEAKYLNTSETPIYKKSTVLYGLDAAKKAISSQRVAVVVEGYTDVMACHLAGVETAVASCGTAFGIDHIKVLRRIMRDEADLEPARVIFTFDGDQAGQAAAMKAFKEDQRWMSQSFVAVAPGGKDPCELRQSDGDAAVRALVEDAVPMFEFAVRTTIARFDLDTAEGRVAAIRAAAPIVAEIRDQSLRPEYTRRVAGLVGVEVELVAAEARRAAAAPTGTGRERHKPERVLPEPSESMVEPSADELAAAFPQPNLRDPVVQAERQLLQCLLQFPDAVDPLDLPLLEVADFTAAAHQAVFAAVAGVGLPSPTMSAPAWHSALAEAAPLAIHPLLAELAVASLPVLLDPMTGRPATRYVDSLVTRVREVALSRQIADALGQLRRLDATPDADADPDRRRALAVRLQDLQRQLAALRDREEA
ncbi:MAG: DNA primase [Actinomycetales bacterium]|nr:DNA primase [Candidatus Phosphoribacter baldrii]